MIRKLLAVAAVAAAFASVQGVASADPAPQKELCKNGGYASYVDPTTSLPFADQSRCVSFVNGGGTLVPISTPKVEIIDVQDPAFDEIPTPGIRWPYTYVVRISGFPADSGVKLTYTMTRQGTTSSGSNIVGVGADGTLTLPYRDTSYCDEEMMVTASRDGLTASAVVPKPAACADAPDPVYAPSIDVTTYDPDENGVFGYSLALNGFAPSSELTLTTHTAGQDSSSTGTTDGAGYLRIGGRFVAQCGDEVSVTASTTGATLTVDVPSPASCQESGAAVTFSDPDRGYGLNILVEGLDPGEIVQLKYVYANGEVGTIGGFTASATGVVELLEYSGGLRGQCWMEPIHIDVVRADGTVDSSAPYFYPDCR